MSFQAVAVTPIMSDNEVILLGAVHLDVTDLDRSLPFWHGAVGLRALSPLNASRHEREANLSP